MARLQLWKIPLVLLCGALVTGGLISAQLTIYANTPSPSTDGTANTVMGVVGSNIVSAYLGSGSNALLWGYVPSDAIIAACEQIVKTGSYELTATVYHNWGDGPSDLTFQIENTGGCLAASDGSGTEIVGTDQSGRRSAIVCQDNAGQVVCPVWITGEDVDSASTSFALQNADSRSNQRRLLIDPCGLGATAGSALGTALYLQPLGIVITCLDPITFVMPFLCVAGMVTAAIAAGTGGAIIGCATAMGFDSACFPASALVQLQNGMLLPMMHLEVGQKVAVWKTSESNLSSSMVTYDEIYAFGHKDAFSKGSFYKITMIPLELGDTESGADIAANNLTRTLEISGLHFLPTMNVTDSNTGNHQVLYKRAKDIIVGEYVWAVADEGLARPHIVTTVSVTFKQGLYNPLTLSGTIVVNMVVASVHSDWFLDSTFEMLGISSSLPYAYQTVLAPLRLVYKMWPKRLYVYVYDRLDARLHVAEFGTKFYCLTVAIVGLITSLLPAASYLCSRFLVRHSQKLKLL